MESSVLLSLSASCFSICFASIYIEVTLKIYVYIFLEIYLNSLYQAPKKSKSVHTQFIQL